MSAEPLLVLCTCPDQDTAQSLAKSLVEQRLAACVSALPGMQSTYRWDNELQHDTEVLLQIKTTVARFAEVQRSVLAQHPHELPELIGIPITAGLPGYLDWLQAETLTP